jgi:hypothetical protein
MEARGIFNTKERRERRTRRSEWRQGVFLTRRNEGSEEHEGANGGTRFLLYTTLQFFVKYYIERPVCFERKS